MREQDKRVLKGGWEIGSEERRWKEGDEKGVI